MRSNYNKDSYMKKTKEFVIMFFGVTILSAGVYFFKIPNGFVTGGVSGIGTILGSLLPFFSAAPTETRVRISATTRSPLTSKRPSTSLVPESVRISPSRRCSVPT